MAKRTTAKPTIVVKKPRAKASAPTSTAPTAARKPPRPPGVIYGQLDFSRPENSGLLMLLEDI
jgi:hypothetical protein